MLCKSNIARAHLDCLESNNCQRSTSIILHLGLFKKTEDGTLQSPTLEAIKSLYYNSADSAGHNKPKQDDQATVILTVAIASDTLKLDPDDGTEPFYSIVTARAIKSAKEDSPITIATGIGRSGRMPLSPIRNIVI